MQEIYEKAWEKGGLQFRGSFSDLVTNVEANKTASDFIKSKINETVLNKKFAAILSDIDHPYAGKRPPIDTNYFETYNRDNINLVDLRRNPITQIDEKGIQTEKEHFDLDIIGLMCIPPNDDKSDLYFREMQELNKKFGLSDLSMGMSSDYISAIDNGATYIRVGSKIFGERSR